MLLKQSQLYPHLYVNSCGTIVYNTKLHKYSKISKNQAYYTASGVHIHRLVASAFCFDTYFEGATVDHIDANKTNNYYKNLEWVSQKENARRMRLRFDWSKNSVWLNTPEAHAKQAKAISGENNPAAQTYKLTLSNGEFFIIKLRNKVKEKIEELFNIPFSISSVKNYCANGIVNKKYGFKIERVTTTGDECSQVGDE